MNDVEAVEPQEAEPIEQIMDQHEIDTNVQEGNDTQDLESSHEKTMVPLSALQKQRMKTKELELELQWERQERLRASQQKVVEQPVEDDSARYESATREDLRRSEEEIIRIVDEKRWIKDNPEKYERVTEFLPKFLKQRPNLASAINLASNRYEEAYELMDKLSPRQEQQIRKASAPSPKKEVPHSPGGVPKAAMMNETIDVMNMSDKEFSEWRQAQKRKR